MKLFNLIKFEYRISIYHHITIHTWTFCEKILWRFTISTWTRGSFLFKRITSGFIYNNLIGNTWSCPPSTICGCIGAHCLCWNRYHRRSHNSRYWNCPLDEPPGEWYHQDTECELREHYLVAELVLTKHRTKCYEDEEDSIDEVDNIRYCYPECIHRSSEAE